jgi:hypothetical protein
MRNVVALMLGVLLPLLGFADVGQAQSAIQVQGTIQAVDCNAQTITISGDGGSNTVTVGTYTAILIGSTSVPLCALQDYIGAPVSVWLVASGSDFAATQVNVSAEGYTPPAPAAYEAAPLPITGIVLGTIVVAGLVYLLVHGPDGGYYRYPYYGPYYAHYYRPYYHPYYGYYPAFVPVILVPAPIVGIVLGTIVVGSLTYIVCRDDGGHFYRYPYYGPYRDYYTHEHHATYQAYRGTYGNAPFNAPIRQGDARWDGPSHAGGQATAPAFHGPSDPRPGAQRVNQPTVRGPVNQPTPTYRVQNDLRTGAQQPSTNRTFQAQPGNQPTFRGPASQPTPTYRVQNDLRVGTQQPSTNRTFQPRPGNQPSFRGPVNQHAPAFNGGGQQYDRRGAAGGSGQPYNRGRGSNCGSRNQSCENGGH